MRSTKRENNQGEHLGILCDLGYNRIINRITSSKEVKCPNGAFTDLRNLKGTVDYVKHRSG
jgi:hypothetical protein